MLDPFLSLAKLSIGEETQGHQDGGGRGLQEVETPALALCQVGPCHQAVEQDQA